MKEYSKILELLNILNEISICPNKKRFYYRINKKGTLEVYGLTTSYLMNLYLLLIYNAENYIIMIRESEIEGELNHLEFIAF